MTYGQALSIALAACSALTAGCGGKAIAPADGGSMTSSADSSTDGSLVATAGCSPACTNGSCCSGKCVELGNDPVNCGTCGSTCGTDEKCVAGSCKGCTPNCPLGSCGDDGCGASCGDCLPGNACVMSACVPCTPQCSGKACGDDGCGGSCGTCLPGQGCDAGQCAACRPLCFSFTPTPDVGVVGEPLTCGTPDGCGQACTGVDYPCPGGGSCSNGTCGSACVPDCSGKACGNDGCGGQCSACPWPQTCANGATCCLPQCSGHTCGNDGCGGFCGTCSAGSVCVADQCVDQAADAGE
jgi:hypothetical protein